MKTTLLTFAVSALALAAPALAQSPQQFVPYVVEKTDHDQFVAWLNSAPMARQQSDVILQWLFQLEQRAIAKQATDAKAAPK